MKTVLSLLLFGSAYVFGQPLKAENDSMSATHTTVKALVTEDRVVCREQGLCPIPGVEVSQRINCPQGGGSLNIPGQSLAFPCLNVNVLDFIPLSGLGLNQFCSGSGCDGNDIWGWTDPQTGDKWAIVGTTVGTSIVKVTDPENAEALVWIASNVGTSTIWRDMKVLNNWVYIVADRSGQYMQYFDLTRLRTVTEPIVLSPNGVFQYTTGTGNTHNIVINEDTDGAQLAYLVGNNGCSGGLYAVDISVPGSPVYGGCFSSDGYTHDAQCVTYVGPDTNYVGREICFGYNENSLTIVDFSNRNSPVMIGRSGYVGVAYSHQGWLSEDMKYAFLDDELDESRQTSGYQGRIRTYVWDVTDLTNPTVIDVFQHPMAGGIDHNLYVKGEYIYEANYELGLRVEAINRDGNNNYASLEEVAYLDTYPNSNNVAFNGAWSNYPYFEYEEYENVVVVQDINRGLFVLEVTGLDAEKAKSKRQYYKDLALNSTKY